MLGQDVQSGITNHHRRGLDGERILGDAHRRRLVDLLGLGERRRNREVIPCCHQRTAVAVVELSACRVVVQLGVGVTRISANIGRIDAIDGGGGEQAAGDGLLAKPAEDVMNDLITVAEEAMDRTEGRSTFKSAQAPDGFILKLPGDRAWTIDAAIVTLQQPPKEFGGFVDFLPSAWILSERR